MLITIAGCCIQGDQFLLAWFGLLLRGVSILYAANVRGIHGCAEVQ